MRRLRLRQRPGAALPLVGTLLTAACGAPRSPRPEAPPVTGAPLAVGNRIARIGLGSADTARLSAPGAWRLVAGDRELARGRGGTGVIVRWKEEALTVTDATGRALDVTGPISIVADATEPIVALGDRRYRGDLTVVASDSGLVVVNRVALEAYLRGVVPRELGVRDERDRAALEAQAVAARSYTVARLGNASRAYDLVATTADQVYGGVDAENPAATAAVAATAGLVLTYDGRVVSAPYHSTCGGSTAAPDEVWRSRAEPFLQPVSDRIPGTDRYYCDIAPRFRWERTWRGDSLTALVQRYLRSYATPAPPIEVGALRAVTIDGRTRSGRVAAVVFVTDAGRFRVRGNDVRYVLRSPGGELLNSTYFSPEALTAPDGRLVRLTLRGLGYGHGVGMCQWGAIGRARAGQDFRTILRTYFPGTSVARAY